MRSPQLAAAIKVLKALRAAGHEAYFAGGCVRDLLMGRAPTDYDIATSARPEAVLALFPRTVAVGAHFGVVVVREGEHEFEVATFRADGAYLDGRHPSAVRFATAAEDVARRDFTINGLLYDPETEEVIDHVGGQADLVARRIRCIGDPEQRFAEDRLRLLRAVRFAVRFDFEIAPETWSALRARAPEITQVSQERIRDELCKMLLGPAPERALGCLHDAGLLQAVLPEVAALAETPQPPEYHPEGDVLTHTALVLSHLKVDPTRPRWEQEALVWAALLHDVGKPATLVSTDRIRFPGHAAVGAEMAERIARRLRLSGQQVDRIVHLTADHARFIDVRCMRRSKLIRFLRLPHFDDLLRLHRADRLAGSGDLTDHDFCVAERTRLSPTELKPARLLDGHQLMALGVAPGPGLGELLRALEDAQLEGQVTTADQAVSWIKARLARVSAADPEADDSRTTDAEPEGAES